MLSVFFIAAAPFLISPDDFQEARAQTQSSYERTASNYLTKNRELFDPSSLDVLLKHLPSGSKILDLGCGPGLHAQHLSALGHEVTGIDYSPAMIRAAQNHATEAQFLVMDMELLSFTDNHFDAVWASRSLHHLPQAQLKESLDEVYRVMKADSIFALSIQTGEGEGMIEDHAYEGVKKFYSYTSEETLLTLLKEVGFEILDSQFSKISSAPSPLLSVLCKKS